jgi:hypothetical protein
MHSVFEGTLLAVSRHCPVAAEYAVTEGKGIRTETANKGPAVSHFARRGTNGRIHY